MFALTRVGIFCIALLSATSAPAQERFSFFQGSTPEGVLSAGANREVLTDLKLSGENISFHLAITLEGIGLTRQEFSGKVSCGRIQGAAQVGLPDSTCLELPWRASRTTNSEYFAPTGANMP